MPDVIVIGGGISGLATAHGLMARGYDVQVVERRAQVGGNAQSERMHGFLMEHGPTTLNASFAPAMECVSALGLDQSTLDLGTGVRKRYLRDAGRLHGISTNPLGFFLSPYLSMFAKLSMLGEFMRPRKADGTEETIHAFATRRFGREFADRIIEPLAAGIFMGDSRELSVDGAFPRLAEMEARSGSILRSVIAARRGSEPGRQLFSWPDGIGTLPRALAAELAGRVTRGVTVTRLRRESAGFVVDTARNGTLRARAVVIAVQPHVAATFVERLDPDAADALLAIAAPAVGVVYLGYRAGQVAHPLDGLGFLGTRDPARLISGAQFCSTMFPGRAPQGHVSISCYAGGARNPEVSGMADAELVARVHSELADQLGIAGEPMLIRTRRWPLGLPHYTLGHTARRQVVETATQRVPGLYLTGNYLSGVSVNSCLEQAGITAGAVSDVLASRSEFAGVKRNIAQRAFR